MEPEIDLKKKPPLIWGILFLLMPFSIWFCAYLFGRYLMQSYLMQNPSMIPYVEGYLLPLFDILPYAKKYLLSVGAEQFWITMLSQYAAAVATFIIVGSLFTGTFLVLLVMGKVGSTIREVSDKVYAKNATHTSIDRMIILKAVLSMVLVIAIGVAVSSFLFFEAIHGFGTRNLDPAMGVRQNISELRLHMGFSMLCTWAAQFFSILTFGMFLIGVVHVLIMKKIYSEKYDLTEQKEPIK